MIFAEIHRRFIAPHLLRHAACIPNDALFVLSVGEAPVQHIVRQAVRLLQEQVGIPLRLLQAGMETDSPWPLLVRASIVVCEGRPRVSPWPLRAMAADIPVVETDGENAVELAARLRPIIEEPARRRRLVLNQRAALETLAPETLMAAFGDESPPMGENRPHCGGWRIEGPFDSSFSLAIVNRSLALELERQGESVALGSVDADGPRPPDPAFLAAEPHIEALWRRGTALSLPDVVTRNLWPPDVLDMRGLNRVMANYAWEESGFPPQDVAAFNATLNLITVTSHFVTKVLRDNGVQVPIAMVGNGIFQPPERHETASTSSRPFRYLHVSSCYPRKGVDVLLAAWAQGFTHEDGVELVIKTFPNAFHAVSEQIADLKRTCPGHAPIILIEADISEERMHQLYASADAVVCPARGEGFGLPMAEAFAHGKPVVTTGFSGQRDFCTPETAWLCDFHFAYSRAHLGMSVSVWAEPDIASLIAAMRAVRAATPEEVLMKVRKGQALLESTYNWGEVTRKTRQAVDRLEGTENAILHQPHTVWLEPWSPEHPVSDYVSGTHELEKRSFFTAHQLGSEIDAVCISDHAASVGDIADVTEQLEARGISTFIFLHDLSEPETAMKADYQRLTCATRLIVHSAHGLNILKNMGLVENVALLPYGVPPPFAGEGMATRRALGLERCMVLATCGPAHPRKGLREMIESLALLLKSHPDLHLLMIHEHSEESAAELEACRRLISAKTLGPHITLVTDALSEQEQMAHLSAADIAVFPTQQDEGDIDKNVRLAIAAGVPCACTHLPIFDDVAPITRTLSGFTPEDLAAGLSDLLKHQKAREMQIARQAEWAAQITRPIIARRVHGMVRGLVLDRNLALSLPDAQQNAAPAPLMHETRELQDH